MQLRFLFRFLVALLTEHILLHPSEDQLELFLSDRTNISHNGSYFLCVGSLENNIKARSGRLLLFVRCVLFQSWLYVSTGMFDSGKYSTMNNGSTAQCCHLLHSSKDQAASEQDAMQRLHPGFPGGKPTLEQE